MYVSYLRPDQQQVAVPDKQGEIPLPVLRPQVEAMANKTTNRHGKQMARLTRRTSANGQYATLRLIRQVYYDPLS